MDRGRGVIKGGGPFHLKSGGDMLYNTPPLLRSAIFLFFMNIIFLLFIIFIYHYIQNRFVLCNPLQFNHIKPSKSEF